MEINKIIRSKDRRGTPGKFDDLINGRFMIDNLIRIEYGRNQDVSESDDISGKAFEFSARTIKYLIEAGKSDTFQYKGAWKNWLV